MAYNFGDLSFGETISNNTISFIQNLKTSSKRKNNARSELKEDCFRLSKKTKTADNRETVETQNTLLDVDPSHSETPLQLVSEDPMEPLIIETGGCSLKQERIDKETNICELHWLMEEGYFSFVPCELLYFKIFIHLPISSLGSVFRVRRRWSKASCQEMFWKEYTLRNIPPISLPRPYSPQYFKPSDRNWKWLVQMQVPLPSSPLKFTGVGKSATEGAEYKGEWKDGEKTGRGVIQLNQDFFLGEFLNGVANGNGAYYWSDGNKFEGTYQDGWRTGNGTFIWANGHKYVGQWDRDCKTGKGCYYWPNGNWYEGDFFQDQRTGAGVFHWRNGDVYVGQFRHGMKHGLGTLIWTNGDKYEGGYCDDKRNGRGKYSWADGDQYEGDYVDDHRNGHGVYRFSDGNLYIGQHVRDVQEGQGTFYWNNGNKYEGEFQDNKRGGRGTFTEKNGHVITGQWNGGLPVNSEGKFSIQEVVERLHPLIRQAIRNKVCTYAVTGKERYGQLLYETREMDDRPHGVCIVCAATCVPRNGVKYYDKDIKFGGNFYCDCGASTDSSYPCFSNKKTT